MAKVVQKNTIRLTAAGTAPDLNRIPISWLFPKGKLPPADAKVGLINGNLKLVVGIYYANNLLFTMHT